MRKIPLLHIGVALIVNIVKPSAARDKVGGIVVDVQPGRVEKVTHSLHLLGPAGFHLSSFEKLRHCLPGDVLLQNTLLLDIDRQKPGHGDAELAQRFIVAQLGLQLIAERKVFARLVVELL